MEDGVLGILPALVRQARLGRAGVVDQTVAVAVAVVPHPLRRGDQIGPQRPDRLQVAGAAEPGAGQGDEQTGGVYPAVIEAERHLPERTHLPAPGLVHDLAGLAVLEGRDLGRLTPGQIGQHPLGQRRIEPQHLPGADDPVPPERRREPRRTGIRIRTCRQVGGQQGDVGSRLVQPGVEPGAARPPQRGSPPTPAPHRQPRLHRVLTPAPGIRSQAHLRTALDVEIQLLAHRQAEHELGPRAVQSGGWFGKRQAAGPHHLVQPGVAEVYPPSVGGGRLARSSPLP